MSIRDRAWFRRLTLRLILRLTLRLVLRLILRLILRLVLRLILRLILRLVLCLSNSAMTSVCHAYWVRIHVLKGLVDTVG